MERGGEISIAVHIYLTNQTKAKLIDYCDSGKYWIALCNCLYINSNKVNIMNTDKNKTSDHLANERTFLAWLRTSIALMGFGLILVKFSLFLKQISFFNADRHIAHSHQEYSGITGLVLIAAGAMILCPSYLNYRRTQKRIEENIFVGSNTLVLFVTALIMSISVFLIVYFLYSL